MAAQPAAAEYPPATADPTPEEATPAAVETSAATTEATPQATPTVAENSAAPAKSATDTPVEEPTPTADPDSTTSSPSTSQSTRTARAAEDDSKPVLGIQKRHDLGDDTLKPGDAITYELVIQCQGLKVDCLNHTVSDVLPAGLDVVSIPRSIDGDRVVVFDEDTRELGISFIRPLQVPAGELGLTAGSTVNLQISMRLPADTDLVDGTIITNTADANADNADPRSDSVDVVVEVPRTVTPVVTKNWAGTAVAGTGTESTVKLGVRNASSTSAEVTELVVTDDSAAPFEHFDFTGASLTRFPVGADTATVRMKTSTGWVDAGVFTETGAFSLPMGVNAADVVGLEVVFTDAGGDVLPVSSTQGTLEMGLVLRDTLRSTGEPLRPTNRVDVKNCANPGATDKSAGAVQGDEQCSTYFIQPDTLVLQSSKKFFADTNGNFARDNGEHAVVGLKSPVSATIDVKNASPFNIQGITITEPDAGTTTEFDKMDVSKVRTRFPGGATTGALRVLYSDGSTTTTTVENNKSYDVAVDGKRVIQLEVTYTGGTGEYATIAPDATAGLDLHGVLNDLVTDEDLPGGDSPGVDNCAAYAGSAGRTDGTGTAVGSACATLPVEAPRYGKGVGVKSVSQATIPEGQPVNFTLQVNNNGNRDLVNPVINDPQAEADGTPVTPNIFDSVRITGASVSKAGGTPDVVVEVFDTGDNTWKAFDASDADLLERASGIRARMLGDLRPTSHFTLTLTVERRDGVADDVELTNCFLTTADGDFTSGDPACSPGLSTGPADSGASLNKSISPGSLPKYVPGLPKQFADVNLRVQNNGNLSAKSLQVIDQDVEFFDAVDFVKIKSAQMPAGANRVRVDALVDGDWVSGTPAANPALPTGVAAADVRGVRATFTSTSDVNDGYVITPCTSDGCVGRVVFQVSPRQHLRSNPEAAVEGTLSDTLTGSYLTNIELEPRPVGPVEATLTITDGAPKLGVDKSPDSNLQPGEPAPFRLKVTNTGTANLAGLVVKDSLPQGIEFSDTFAGDGGKPFKVIAVDVPEGTPKPPTPVFTTTNDGERVSGLSWDFSEAADGQPWLLAPGATLTIEIQVRLEAGVTFGQVVTNTMGATGTTPGLTCDKPGDDSVFGENHCTDTASLKVMAGAAFNARKWVSGNEDLGWYNTFTSAGVPVGDSSCPAATDAAGLAHTSFPCIALVNPGDQFSYMLRLTNAGTESGTHMRIVDRFPVEGDRGVNIDQPRGTQWNNRPTLASEPKLDGPGTMTTSYTTDQDLCIKDLDMGGAGTSAEQCPADAWSDAFGADVSAAKFDLAFDPQIKPGERVDITFTMDAPLEVAQVSDPTIAWNSFAHAETTDRNGRPNVLPVTEPIQVGVATSYGSLQLLKEIGDNPAGLVLAEREFEFNVVCSTTPQGHDEIVVVEETVDVSSESPHTIDGIPAGASCAVWETDAQGGISSHGQDNPLTIDIEPMLGTDATVQTATITNDFPLTRFAVTKVVDGDAAEFAPGSFPVDITCTFDGAAIEGYDPVSVTLVPGEETLVDVPSGSTCTAVETESGMATEVTYDPASEAGDASAPVDSQAGVTGEVGITNTFRAGGVVVHKEVTGAGTPELAQGPFSYDVACTFNGEDLEKRSVTIDKGDGTQTDFVSDAVTGLPAGAQCAVTETDNGGADFTPAPIDVIIRADENVVVGFTGDSANHFSAGTVGVVKELDGDAYEEDWATEALFDIAVTCQREVSGEDEEPMLATVFSDTVQIRGDQRIDELTDADGNVVKLPVGTRCFGEETDTGGATSHRVVPSTFDSASEIVARKNPYDTQGLTIEATNTFEYGSLELNKIVDGEAAGFVGVLPFEVAVSCVLPQSGEDTVIFDAKSYEIVGGQSITIEGELPVGALCWAEETEQRNATEVSITHGDRENAAVVGEDETVGITVTNTFHAGGLIVHKDVTGSGAPELAQGPFSYDVACFFNGQEIDRDVTIAKGEGEQVNFESDAVTGLPAGANCVVTETDNGGADFTPEVINVKIVANENVVAGFTGDSSNQFSSGTIGVAKVLEGDAAGESWATDATFQVAVTCEREVTGEDEESLLATVFSRTVAIRGGETIDALTDGDGNPVKLPVGTRCHGEETETAGATSFSVSPDNFEDAEPIVATEDSGEVQALSVTATNVFEYGSLELFKKVDGEAAGYVGDREFTLDVSCVLPQAGIDTVIRDAEPVIVTGGQSVVIDALPVGAQCWAEESDTGGATEVAIDHGTREDAAVVGQDEAAAITVTNSFAAAELTVGKTVVNGPAGPYDFTLACTTEQGEVELPAEDASFQLKHGQTRTVSVPEKSTCVVEESAVDGATVTFQDSDDTHDGRVTVDGRASVQVTNTFAEASLPDDGGKPGGEPGGKPGGQLPNAGGPSAWLVVVGLLATAGGAGVLINRRRVA